MPRGLDEKPIESRRGLSIPPSNGTHRPNGATTHARRQLLRPSRRWRRRSASRRRSPRPTPASPRSPAPAREGSSGDSGAATDAKLDEPEDVALLPGGGYLIADTKNHRIRKVGSRRHHHHGRRHRRRHDFDGDGGQADRGRARHAERRGRAARRRLPDRRHQERPHPRGRRRTASIDTSRPGSTSPAAVAPLPGGDFLDRGHREPRDSPGRLPRRRHRRGGHRLRRLHRRRRARDRREDQGALRRRPAFGRRLPLLRPRQRRGAQGRLARPSPRSPAAATPRPTRSRRGRQARRPGRPRRPLGRWLPRRRRGRSHRSAACPRAAPSRPSPAPAATASRATSVIRCSPSSTRPLGIAATGSRLRRASGRHQEQPRPRDRARASRLPVAATARRASAGRPAETPARRQPTVGRSRAQARQGPGGRDRQGHRAGQAQGQQALDLAHRRGLTSPSDRRSTPVAGGSRSRARSTPAARSRRLTSGAASSRSASRDPAVA